MGVILAAVVFFTAQPAAALTVAVYGDDDKEYPGYVMGTEAIGLLIAGRGPTVTPDETREALRGIRRDRCPCDVEIYLPGRPPVPLDVERRSHIVFVGPNYRGLLVSDRTRIPGLISIYDVKPTVEALQRGETPPITAHRGLLAAERRLVALDQRLHDLDRSRTLASFALAAVVAVFALIGVFLRRPLFARAAVLAVPTTLGAALGLSALEVSEPSTVVPLLAVAGAGGALGLGWVARRRLALAGFVVAIFVVYLFALTISTETNSLAVIGPRPENGGRFYGFNNQLETLLLGPGLVAAALLPLLPVALLALVTVGASFAGADGGGVLVFGAGFLVLWMRRRRIPLTKRNLGLAAAGVVAAGLALVGLDAALGGESHVTRSLGGGPDQVLRDVVERWTASVEGVVTNWHSTLVVAAAIPVLLWVGLRRPRSAIVDALLVALAVSLVVNDAPREVLGFGALTAGALRFWWEVAEPVE